MVIKRRKRARAQDENQQRKNLRVRIDGHIKTVTKRQRECKNANHKQIKFK